MLQEAHLLCAAEGGHIRSPEPIDGAVVSPPLLGDHAPRATPGPSDHDWAQTELSAPLHPMACTWRLLRAPACRPFPEAPEEGGRI
eukprot:6943182-Alexandrium_andersonii.AAC.1